MKIIFLDMDGVLCTNRAHEAQGMTDFHKPFMAALDREAIGMLNKLGQKHSDILYVLSSTWRKMHTKEEMETYLKSYGWEGKFHDDWKTDDLWNVPRGLEIEKWMKEHPDVINYIILDDNSDMLDSQKYHFIQTDSYDGILSKHFWRMETIFGTELVQ